MKNLTCLLCVLLFAIVGCSKSDQDLENAIEHPLIIAAETGDLTTLSRLLGEQTNIDVRDACQWTPLMKSALNGHLETTRQLVSAGASVDLADKGGYTAMMLASSNNHSAVVDFLLNKGANVDQVESTAGWTALIWAAKQGHIETVKTLMEHHANPELSDFQGRRAVDWAKLERHTEIISLLNNN